MVQAPLLIPGDLIEIVAPAKAIEAEHVLFAKNFLEQHGFRVKVAKHCLGQYNYFSGSDTERAEDFQQALDDPEVKAILCARGGYGCVRILDRVQWASFIKNPKWLIGFSDVTVFHHRAQRFEIQSIHGSMPLNFSSNTESALNSLITALTKESYSLSSPAHPMNKLGHSEGTLVGGNLAIVCSLIGTKDQIDYSDKILFIEDVGEHLYQIDRMLFQLQKADVFSKIKGLIVGGMTDLRDTEKPFGKSLEQLILEHFTYHQIPICFDFPAGHVDNNNALVFGKQVTLFLSSVSATLHF